MYRPVITRFRHFHMMLDSSNSNRQRKGFLASCDPGLRFARTASLRRASSSCNPRPRASSCPHQQCYSQRSAQHLESEPGLKIRSASNLLFHTSTSGSFSAVSMPMSASKHYFFAFFDIYKMCILLQRSNLRDISNCLQVFELLKWTFRKF